MSKVCPKCGEEVPDDGRFCGNCGYEFADLKLVKPDSASNGSLFSNGKIFLLLIVAILVIGSAFILAGGIGGGSHDSISKNISLVITEVDGDSFTYDDLDGVKGKTEYDLMTSALFYDVPSDLNGYILKTTYYDKDNKSIAQETESLSMLMSGLESKQVDYPLIFGITSFYKKLEPEYVTVEIIKDKNVVANDTFEIDKSSITYL